MLTDYIHGYQHIGIPTDDIEKTTRFYENLGFKLIWETVYNGYPVKFFGCGDILLETYEKDGGAADRVGAIDHIALNCTDIVGCVHVIFHTGSTVSSMLRSWDQIMRL